MTGKRRRKVATFHGIDIKIQRSNFHLKELRKSFEQRLENEAYRFVPEIKEGGKQHLYRADNPPPDDERWGLMAGDCVHNLRSALDHLAVQLVIANRGSPTTQTYFPIWSRRPQRRIPMIRRAVPLRVKGGVHPKALAMIEDVQPYKGSASGTIGNVMKLLADLDIRDKHREFITTSSVVGRAKTSLPWDEAAQNPSIANATMKFTGQPIKHDQVVAVVFYDPPLMKPDPDLAFTPAITFGRGMPLAGESVTGGLWLLWQRVGSYITTFRDFFPNYPN